MNIREKQFMNNINDIIGGVENYWMDNPDEPRGLTWDEWLEYIFPDVYHQKSNGRGITLYGKNICGNLKFIGRARMEELLRETLEADGLISEDAKSA